MIAALNWSLDDNWIVTAGILCAVAAALPGSFLVLRRMSMLGDAISHAVLPGLAAAFLITGSRSSWPMFLGAVATGIATAMLTEWIRRTGRVDEGASMGVVFTTLFALGLVLIVQAADHVDLDPGCVLYGSIETIPANTAVIGGYEIPRVVPVLAGVMLLNLVFIVVFWKELKLSSFDSGLATSTGFNARLLHYGLMTVVAVTSVASFEAVGNILVVAMFVVPPATACLLTDRLAPMVVLAVVLAAASAATGHVGAIIVPGWFGYPGTTTAGMMAVAAGVFFVVALLLAPRHGIVVKSLRRQWLALTILREDILAILFRAEERTPAAALRPARKLAAELLAGRMSLRLALAIESLRGTITSEPGGYRLTSKGGEEARHLIRSHRLWEQYLVERAELPAERIHDKAEAFEHITDAGMRERLDKETSATPLDPHGRVIPPENPAGEP